MHQSSRRAVPSVAALALLIGLATGSAQAEVVVVEKGAMPAPIVEVVPGARAGYGWVPGHWVWRGGAWFWVKGHFSRGMVAPMPEPLVEVVPPRPSPAHFWVKGYHGWEGGRWVWHGGIWVR